uniref:Uncharacterized protein n=1 Tax=Arundo donax TaxID=35708 RepID=A0A0A9EE23_ARUDO
MHLLLNLICSLNLLRFSGWPFLGNCM